MKRAKEKAMKRAKGKGDEEGEGEGNEEGEGEGDEESEGEGDEESDREGDEESDGEGDKESDGEGDKESDGEGDGESKTEKNKQKREQKKGQVQKKGWPTYNKEQEQRKAPVVPPLGGRKTHGCVALVRGFGVGWCQQREKIDWQEPHKFDCRLGQTIFIFLLSLVNFLKSLRH